MRRGPRMRRLLAAALLMTCFGLLGPAAKPAMLAQAAPQAASQAAAGIDPSLFGGLRWRSLGPARGGRSQAVAGSNSRPLEYYFGATGGGLWKTSDGGLTWKAV